MPDSPQRSERLARAIHSLHGLSCGDAFGERFFLHPEVAQSLIAQHAVPSSPWHFTDDTVMAIAIAETLEEFGEIREEALAENFGRRYLADPQRGYGLAMHGLLPEIARLPSTWKERSEALFRGAGSFGNGSAMRVAPLGAYFADDFDALFNQAISSSVVTHSHPEAIAGAVAVAFAAALAFQHRSAAKTAVEFLQEVGRRTPESEVQQGIETALALPRGTTAEKAAATLGSGAKISAQDTVPFCLWAAAHHLDNYEEALWTTVSGLGDRDTTCAIVGGIVSLSAGVHTIPPMWLEAREPLPLWFLNPGSERL